MKLSEIYTKAINRAILKEMPYELAGDMYRSGISHAFISDSTLSRKYDYLGIAEVFVADNALVELHLLKARPHVIGTVHAPDKDNIDVNQIIFSLAFKTQTTLKKLLKDISTSKLIQVDKVVVDDRFEGQGIASYAYASLVQKGYSILSDSSQFTDGKELWKRMARRAHLRKYKIYVLNDELGFLEKDGEPIEYNASNIDYAHIWSKNQDYSKERVLLLMTK